MEFQFCFIFRTRTSFEVLST